MQTNTSPSITNLARALLGVQRSLKTASLDSNNPHFGSRYASLEAVMESCRDALFANGVLVTQIPEPAEGAMCLETVLIHAESGEWLSGRILMPLARQDPQSFGSAVTYARRYSLSSMLGIVTGEDDDAESAMPPRQQPHPHEQQPRQEPEGQAQAEQPPQPRSDVPHSTVAAAGNASAPLPDLPGIEYERTTDSGRRIIVARGRTMDQRDALKANGFRWSPEMRSWWRNASA